MCFFMAHVHWLFGECVNAEIGIQSVGDMEFLYLWLSMTAILSDYKLAKQNVYMGLYRSFPLYNIFLIGGKM